MSGITKPRRLFVCKSILHLSKGALALLILTLSPNAFSEALCTLTNFTVITYDHGGTYLHGTMNGVSVAFVTICGETAGNQDCNAQATNRHLSVALAAQAAGRSLEVGFWNLISCSAFQPYMRVASIRMLN
jgi:hypothetical protein